MSEAASATSRKPNQRTWWIIAAVGIAAMAVLAAWFGLALSKNVSATQAGFSVKSDSLVEVRWDVVTPEKKPVTCRLIALDNSRNVVGTKVVNLAVSKFDSTRYTAEIKTTSRPVTATVDQCQYTDQAKK